MKKDKSSTELLIAKYGLIGTIITAIIGLFAAYLGYLGNKVQADRPLHATETAEARSMLALTETGKTDLVNSPTPGQLYKSTPDITQTPFNIDDIVRVEKEWSGCPMRHILPDYIDPNNGVETANEQFREYLQNELSGESIFSTGSVNWTRPYYAFTLTGASSNKEWIILDKEISVYIHRTEIPEHTNIAMIGGCGGEMVVRNFPDLKLDSDHDDYMIKETYEDDSIAKFTLMPGEPELFQIPLTCGAPGVYNLEVRMNMKYMEQANEISISVPPYFCPDSFTQWGINEILIKDVSFTFGGNYKWSGSEYVAVP